jgi:hypothetical protein
MSNMKQENPNPQGTDSEEQRQEAVKRFKELADKPPAKVPFFKKTGVRVTGALLCILAVLGIGGYELGSHGIINVPGIHQKIDVPSIYDNNAEVNYIKAGVNVQPATEQQISDFLNATPPVIEASAPGDKNIPQIEIMDPVIPQGNETIKITKSIYSLPENPKAIQSNLGFNLNKGDNFPVPLFRGVKTVDMETELLAPGVVGGIDLRYHLNDGQIFTATISFVDNNYISTDVFKNLPQYDTRFWKGPAWAPGSVYQTFDLNQNPDLNLLKATGKSTIVFFIESGNLSNTDKFFINPVFTTDNGKALSSASAK